ncbi:MAG: class III signal peptide-containing protein [Methanobrevibacter sp.]|nr:class III signal peptide-containing protein [Methanobrevibacter sp.]
MYKKFLNEDKAQAGAEMLLLIGGMMIIVLIAIYFYNDYLSRIGNEVSSTELNKLDDSIKNISLKFS